jgi:guanylate kinase
MGDASQEISHCSEFDFLLVNDELDATLSELRLIVQSGRLRRARQMGKHQDLLERLLESP